MNDDDFKKIEERYFLVKKSSFWVFVGGAVAFTVANAGISYKSALEGMGGKAARAALTHIQTMENEAQTQLGKISAIGKSLDDRKGNLIKIMDLRIRRRVFQKELEDVEHYSNPGNGAPVVVNLHQQMQAIDNEIAGLNVY